MILLQPIVINLCISSSYSLIPLPDGARKLECIRSDDPLPLDDTCIKFNLPCWLIRRHFSMTVSGWDISLNEDPGWVFIFSIGLPLKGWWSPGSISPVVSSSAVASTSTSIHLTGLTIIRVKVNHSRLARKCVGRDPLDVNETARRPMLKKGIDRPSRIKQKPVNMQEYSILTHG